MECEDEVHRQRRSSCFTAWVSSYPQRLFMCSVCPWCCAFLRSSSTLLHPWQSQAAVHQVLFFTAWRLSSVVHCLFFVKATLEVVLSIVCLVCLVYDGLVVCLRWLLATA